MFTPSASRSTPPLLHPAVQYPDLAHRMHPFRATHSAFVLHFGPCVLGMHLGGSVEGGEGGEGEEGVGRFVGVVGVVALVGVVGLGF